MARWIGPTVVLAATIGHRCGRAALALASVVVLVGCVQPTAPLPENPESAPPPKSLLDERMTLKDCREWLLVHQAGPAYHATPPPPGWEDDALGFSTLYWSAFECQKFSWGPIERGPIWFVLESINDWVTDVGCLDDARGGREVLRWVFNDTEIIAQLAALGVPALAGLVAGTNVDEVAMEVSTITAEVGGNQSWVEFRAGDEVTVEPDYADRFFWYNETSLFAFDFEQTRRTRNPDYEIVRGDIRPPFAMSRFSEPTYISEGSSLATSDRGVHFMTFNGFDCA